MAKIKFNTKDLWFSMFVGIIIYLFFWLRRNPAEIIYLLQAAVIGLIIGIIIQAFYYIFKSKIMRNMLWNYIIVFAAVLIVGVPLMLILDPKTPVEIIKNLLVIEAIVMIMNYLRIKRYKITNLKLKLKIEEAKRKQIEEE